MKYQRQYRNTTKSDYPKISTPFDSLEDLVNAKGIWFSNSKVAFISTDYEDMWTESGFKDGSHLINASCSCLRMMATLYQYIEEGNVFYYIAKHLFNAYLSISETIVKFRKDKLKSGDKVGFFDKEFESKISQSAYKEADAHRLKALHFFVGELMKKEVHNEA